MRQLQKKIKTGTLNLNQDDPFELFIAATNIRYCYYNETHKVLGNTFGMCVLQVSLCALSSKVSQEARSKLLNSAVDVNLYFSSDRTLKPSLPTS